jgi:hypothetical protein
VSDAFPPRASIRVVFVAPPLPLPPPTPRRIRHVPGTSPPPSSAASSLRLPHARRLPRPPGAADLIPRCFPRCVLEHASLGCEASWDT